MFIIARPLRDQIGVLLGSAFGIPLRLTVSINGFKPNFSVMLMEYHLMVRLLSG